MSGSRLTAAKAIFDALFDGAESANQPWDEGRWQDFMHVFTEAGRFVFGYPHLESSESDIFGALDDIAGELEATKNAIAQTTKEARIVQGELHKALEPLLPDEDEAEGGDAVSVSTQAPIEPAAVNPTAALHDPLMHSDQVDAPAYPGAPQTPNEQDEQMFALVRADPRISYAEIERRLDIKGGRAWQRMQLLAGYETLPADILRWRDSRKGKHGTGFHSPHSLGREDETSRVREVADDIKAREASVLSKNVAEMDDFMARRKANVAAQANAVMDARRNGS